MTSQTHPAQDKIDMLIAEVRRIRALDNELWTRQEIGDHFKFSQRQVGRIIAHPTFPRAIRMPIGESTSHPRWRKREVVAWGERW